MQDGALIFSNTQNDIWNSEQESVSEDTKWLKIAIIQTQQESHSLL